MAAGLLIAEGLLFGHWTSRWDLAPQLPAAVASLERLPLVIGDWHGQPSQDLDERTKALAGFAGYLKRRYENAHNGTAVNVLLACGPCGPLCVHTPEVCYAGSGFVQIGEQSLHSEDLGKSLGGVQFWKAKFSKADGIGPVQVNVYWAWKAQGNWQAPKNPRLAFAGSPVLFKLYITYEILADDDGAGEAHCRAFIRVLLPELEKNLALDP